MTDPIHAGAAPLLSVIIPLYNREKLVLRALASVLRDPGNDIEIVVADDGSTDGSVAAVQSVQDPRVRLIVLDKNGGRCAARNRAAEVARGEWLVFLDSDDEIIPDALNSIRARVRNAPNDVNKILFACRDDNGAISPSAGFDHRVVDYLGHLKWLEDTCGGRGETLPCTRRSAFLQCPYPEDRYSWEGIHELDFVKRFRVQHCPDVVRLYHYDAPVRIMAPKAGAARVSAKGEAAYAETVLERHGEALMSHAPTRWVLFAREAALFNFLAGNRRRGIANSLNVLKRTPTSVRAWAVMVAGSIGPAPLARVWSMRRAISASS